VKNILVLTKREQHIVMIIVTALLAAALAKHYRQKVLPRSPSTTTPAPIASQTPAYHPDDSD
jgi:hypothetical protein